MSVSAFQEEASGRRTTSAGGSSKSELHSGQCELQKLEGGNHSDGPEEETEAPSGRSKEEEEELETRGRLRDDGSTNFRETLSFTSSIRVSNPLDTLSSSPYCDASSGRLIDMSPAERFALESRHCRDGLSSEALSPSGHKACEPWKEAEAQGGRGGGASFGRRNTEGSADCSEKQSTVDQRRSGSTLRSTSSLSVPASLVRAESRLPTPEELEEIAALERKKLRGRTPPSSCNPTEDSK